MPLLLASIEIFDWVKAGKKTIDVRKGKPVGGNIATFECGPRYLRLKIIRTDVGKLSSIVRQDNYKSIIPSAKSLAEAIEYFHNCYGNDDFVCTAYYLGKLENAL